MNAGHPPPLLFGERGVEELTVGGPVIGPLPEATFKRGFAHHDRGGTLVMFTDGLVERHSPGGDMFGADAVREIVRRNPKAPAAGLLEEIFAAAWSFGGGQAWEDDATLVVVRRSGATSV